LWSARSRRLQDRPFSEKPQASEDWINGAFFVLEPKVLDYIEEDLTQFEKEPLERLVRDGQLMAFQHESFWQCMDALREKKILQDLGILASLSNDPLGYLNPTSR
jgi:NDP-sugar pyrophosphorylase family protein